MIRVFFERGGYAELAAVFIDERMYNDCVPALERMAKDMGFDKVTESIEHSTATTILISARRGNLKCRFKRFSSKPSKGQL
jgi:hypothetical protein